MNSHYLSKKLNETVESAYQQLITISENESAVKLQPNKWSVKEIVGHLIDSASNNHQRFVRALFKDDLIFLGYEQDEWVKVQNYQSEDWISLLSLWKEFNLHLSKVINNISENELTKKRTEHNLDEIAWKEVAKSEAATLNYFINDYIEHLQHHLSQIFNLMKEQKLTPNKHQ